MTVFRETPDGGVVLDPLPPRTVTVEKLVAFRRVLGLEGSLPRVVNFANGSTAYVEQRVVVIGSIGGRAVFTPDELRAAYAMALYGSKRTAQPKGDPAKFGDDAPW